MERSILFGDDGSAGADVAWGWIDAQRWPGWRVDALTTDPPPLGPPVDEEEAEPHEWASPHQRIPSPSSEIASVRHLEARRDPRVALLRPDASLIVIGPRGGGLLKSLHLGSTAEFLLHHPPAPLVIARRAVAVRRVLVSTDGSPHADGAVDALATMPWVDRTLVSVLGVEDGFSDIEQGVKHARAALERVAREVSETRVRGPVAWAILQEAERLGADLIVMGTAGTGGLRRLALGSNAAAVARAAPCSVLTVCVNC